MPCQVKDETQVKVRGKWVYVYRAVDKAGKTSDFMLSERRNDKQQHYYLLKLSLQTEFPKK